MRYTKIAVWDLIRLDIKNFLCNYVVIGFKSGSLAAVLSFVTLNYSIAQTRPANEQQVKAAFIYNFTHFIDWPSESFASSKAPFVIGIIGDDPIAADLGALVKDEKFDYRTITIQKFATAKDVDNCNILYISGKEASKVKNILPQLNRRGILTVVDDAGFSKWGGIVCFHKDDNKLRLQINVSEAKAAELTISSKLMSVSDIYKGN